MLIKDIYENSRKNGKIPFSFEFFPPKTEKGWNSLYSTMKDLLPLHPTFVSVTYGAGGSTRENTHDLVSKLHKDGLTVVAHLTCVNSSEDEIASIVDRYNNESIYNILALRGDSPRISESRFVHACDLVSFIKKRYPHFCIGVAGFPEGHPNMPNRLREMDYLKEKVDSGADYIITQMFFDNRDYYDFCERCQLASINVPIVAGLMPITTLRNLDRMAELTGGTRFPASLIRRIKRVTINNNGHWGALNLPQNNTSEIDSLISQIGEQWASEQISDLLNNEVLGIHLYTLNHSSASIRIMKNLGLKSYSFINS